jgi:agmatinase
VITFYGAPSVPDLAALDAQVALLGVPYDRGTPPGLPTGQRGGPAAARAASVEQFAVGAGFYDVETGRDHLVGVTLADVGDEADYDRLSAVTSAIAARGALLAAFGGDHAISFPLGRGLEALGPFDVVHVDAHADFYDEVEGSRSTGASQLRRLAELPFVGMVSAIGLRNADRAEIDDIRGHGGRFATTREVLERGAADVVAENVRATPLYVSVDLDVLDSSVAPGHSLPEPGGLSYRELRALLAAVAHRGRVIGFDVVELNPALDPSGATARVAAWVATHLLCEVFDQPR